MKNSQISIPRNLLLAAQTTGATALVIFFVHSICRLMGKAFGFHLPSFFEDASQIRLHTLVTLPLVFVTFAAVALHAERKKSAEKPTP